MLNTSTATTKITRPAQEVKNPNKPKWIFVLQLNNGRYVVGQAFNPSRRIAAINSGLNPLVKEPLSIYRIVGVKEQTQERTLISVVTKLAQRFGNDRVIAL